MIGRAATEPGRKQARRLVGPSQETEGPAVAGPAAYFFPWPGGAPPCPGALPECPDRLVSCPGALPVWPGALPEFPRGRPAWPAAPPTCLGGLAAWPGAVSLWLGAVLLLWPGAVPLSLGDLGVWPGTFPVCPGDVAERPGAFPECRGVLGAWLPAVFLLLLACVPLLGCGAFDFLPFGAGHGPILSPWPRWAGRAFRETMIVTNGFFLECVRWQIVTFLGYWDAAAGVRAGDTAAPIDATAPTARAVTAPTAAPRPQPHLEGRVMSVDSPLDPFDSRFAATGSVYVDHRPGRNLR